MIMKTLLHLGCILVFSHVIPRLECQNVPHQQLPPTYHKRFEFKHSFRAPNLAHKDGTISFWKISGDALAHSDQIRLAPSMTSKSGAAWNVKPMIESDFWTVEMSLKISGRGRIGADGLAMWYTAAPSGPGPVFGSSEQWTGLGLFFDSFDNDYNRDAPFIGMMFNDGTKTYDQTKDGGDNILAKCQKDFRNKPFPVKARIEYLQNTLAVYIHNGNTANDQYELCMKAENVFLPKGGYFGLSAATGGLADDHDVTSFEVWSHSPSRPSPPAMMPVEEQKKIEEEYKRQEEGYKQEREKYQKEHPEKAKLAEEEQTLTDPLERYSLSMLEALQLSDMKISQILEKVQNLGSMAGQSASQSGAIVDQTLHRNEATELIQASREINAAVRDIKNFVADIQNRVMVVDQRLTSSAGGGGAAVGLGEQQKAHLEAIKREVEQIRLNQRTQVINCPTVDSHCLSPMIFIFVIVVQSVIFFLYAMFKNKNEKAKFY